ncbi:uncharacterized protein LOC142320811 [Lycorma delicatula]|uniref:uncharacterized protein LOC142320811 n=1 Tax=Lycorma delicatula TaxID=130591 RepID=UPI003F50D8C1
MIRKFTETFIKWGLNINFSKLKWLVQKDFKYLGSILSQEGNSVEDINHCIALGQMAIQKCNSLWWSRDTKSNKVKAVQEWILLYGSEVWEIRKKDEGRLLAVLCRSCGVSRMQCVRNEEIRRRIGATRTMIDVLEGRRLQNGQFWRMEEYRWPRKMLEWIPGERRKCE